MTSVLSSMTNWLSGRTEKESDDEALSAGSVGELQVTHGASHASAVHAVNNITDGQVQNCELSDKVCITNPAAENQNTEDDSVLARVGTHELTGSDASSDKSCTEHEESTGTKSNIPLFPMDVDLNDVSEKALHAAKEWGTYLFSFGKAATEQVTKSAMHLKETVEEKTLIADFAREQEKFLTENREKKKLSEAAVPPWVGYNEEETMRTQILALSKDKRNFLRNPPAGVQFNFDYQSSFPIALVMLEEDSTLKAMRFELVPKQVKEEMFWRNYFYRVSLIKQSTQLTSLAQQTGMKTDMSASRPTSGPKVGSSHGDVKEAEYLSVGSPAEHEFVSDSFQTGDLNDEELKKEMQQLGMNNKTTTAVADDIPEWERELQAELQEYEVVDDGTNMDDADLEKEIMQQIEAESKHL